MLVLNLSCEFGHGFEGWFGSGEDFETQLASGQLSCPVCQSRQVRRMPSAPRLNVAHLRGDVAPAPSSAGELPDVSARGAAAGSDGSDAAVLAQLMQAWQQVSRVIAAQSEDVGQRLAEEARRIHYGESEERPIRGVASLDESQALREEGIELLPLLLPDAAKGPLQ